MSLSAATAVLSAGYKAHSRSGQAVASKDAAGAVGVTAAADGGVHDDRKGYATAGDRRCKAITVMEVYCDRRRQPNLLSATRIAARSARKSAGRCSKGGVGCIATVSADSKRRRLLESRRLGTDRPSFIGQAPRRGFD